MKLRDEALKTSACGESKGQQGNPKAGCGPCPSKCSAAHKPAAISGLNADMAVGFMQEAVNMAKEDQGLLVILTALSSNSGFPENLRNIFTGYKKTLDSVLAIFASGSNSSSSFSLADTPHKHGCECPGHDHTLSDEHKTAVSGILRTLAVQVNSLTLILVGVTSTNPNRIPRGLTPVQRDLAICLAANEVAATAGRNDAHIRAIPACVIALLQLEFAILGEAAKVDKSADPQLLARNKQLIALSQPNSIRV